MKKKYSILMMGKVYNNHMERYVRSMKNVNPEIDIDCFEQQDENLAMPSNYHSLFRECKLVYFTHYFSAIPGVHTLELIYNWRKEFHKFSQNHHYDIVNIHFPGYMMRYILEDLKKIADNVVLTPWGSDVYRIGKKKQKLLSKVYKAADYIIARGRFAEDCMQLFSIPPSKVIEGGMGSETIDYIVSHKHQITTEDAKRHLGLTGSYVVTCGYNASIGQQHIEMINAIYKIKDKLPSKLVLLFPLTYPHNPEYINKLKEMVVSKGIKGVFLDDYLDLDSLYIVRQATDMFIHIQITDANNASLKEYLLLGKTCVNGAWMHYPDIEVYGSCPYYLVDDTGKLGDVILDAYNNGPKVINERAIMNIEQLGSISAAKEINRFFETLVK